MRKKNQFHFRTIDISMREMRIMNLSFGLNLFCKWIFGSHSVIYTFEWLWLMRFLLQKHDSDKTWILFSNKVHLHELKTVLLIAIPQERTIFRWTVFSLSCLSTSLSSIANNGSIPIQTNYFENIFHSRYLLHKIMLCIFWSAIQIRNTFLNIYYQRVVSKPPIT